MAIPEKVSLSSRHVRERWRGKNKKRIMIIQCSNNEMHEQKKKKQKDFIMWHEKRKCYDFIEKESQRLNDTVR